MTVSIKEIKKRGRPPSTGSGKPVLIRFQPEQLSEIENWIALQEEALTLPEAIRRLALACVRSIAASKPRKRSAR
jgi:hypothetical protein